MEYRLAKARVAGSNPVSRSLKSSSYDTFVAACFLSCTQFAHNLWKVVIINDKRDTPVNDILFLSASSIDKEFSQIYAHDEAFTYNLHKRIIRKEISYTPVVIPFLRNIFQ